MITKVKKQEIAEAIDLKRKNGPQRVTAEYSEEFLQFLIDNYNDPDDLAYACYYYGFSMGIYSVLRMKPEFDANRNLEVPGPKLAKQ